MGVNCANEVITVIKTWSWGHFLYRSICGQCVNGIGQFLAIEYIHKLVVIIDNRYMNASYFYKKSSTAADTYFNLCQDQRVLKLLFEIQNIIGYMIFMLKKYMNEGFQNISGIPVTRLTRGDPLV